MYRAGKYGKALLFEAADRALPSWALDGLLRRHLRRQYVNGGVIFVHIPRTGGTSVSTALYTAGVAHRTAEEIRRATGAQLWEAYPAFAIIRDPVGRLLSAYTYVTQSGGRNGVRVARRAYSSEAFASFERFVTEWLPATDLRKEDRLFWPQHWFLEGEGSTPAERWRFPNFEPLASWLSGVTGRRISIPRLNASTRASGDVVISREAISTIKRLYRLDYELFDAARSK